MANQEKKNAWKPGQSGNPNGRPPGSSEVGKLRAAISKHLPEIIDQLVEKARGGDAQAARLLLERVLPPVKATEATVVIDIPDGVGLTEQGAAVMRAVARGLIAPGQGGALLSGLGNVAKLKEIDELTARIEALEAGAGK
jgi:polyhydroxyalkanoate synthesis regulator phasin